MSVNEQTTLLPTSSGINGNTAEAQLLSRRMNQLAAWAFLFVTVRQGIYTYLQVSIATYSVGIIIAASAVAFSLNWFLMLDITKKAAHPATRNRICCCCSMVTACICIMGLYAIGAAVDAGFEINVATELGSIKDDDNYYDDDDAVAQVDGLVYGSISMSVLTSLASLIVAVFANMLGNSTTAL